MKGKTLPVAKALIKAHLCGIGTITRAYSARVAAGRVVSQRPRAGVSRPKFAKVSLVVSRGRG